MCVYQVEKREIECLFQTHKSMNNDTHKKNSNENKYTFIVLFVVVPHYFCSLSLSLRRDLCFDPNKYHALYLSASALFFICFLVQLLFGLFILFFLTSCFGCKSLLGDEYAKCTLKLHFCSHKLLSFV